MDESCKSTLVRGEVEEASKSRCVIPLLAESLKQQQPAFLGTDLHQSDRATSCAAVKYFHTRTEIKYCTLCTEVKYCMYIAHCTVEYWTLHQSQQRRARFNTIMRSAILCMWCVSILNPKQSQVIQVHTLPCNKHFTKMQKCALSQQTFEKGSRGVQLCTALFGRRSASYLSHPIK